MDEKSGVSLVISLIYLAIVIAYVVGLWKMYAKAGKPGWACIVPFYNVYILLKMIGRPGWWLILFLIPFVNLIILLIVALDLAKSFKRGTAFGIVLLWLFAPIGYMILGYGKSTYSGPAAITPAAVTPPSPPVSQT